jgi:exonuclease I
VKFRPFAEAREFVHSLGLKNQQEWEKYCKSGKKPVDIPTHPHIIYKDNWNDFPDWLGYEKKKWRPFEQAREYVRSLGLKDSRQWNEYCKLEINQVIYQMAFIMYTKVKDGMGGKTGLVLSTFIF